MTDSAIGSPMLKARLPLVLDRPDETWFDIGPMHKDIRLVLATAGEEGVSLPSAEVAGSVPCQATELGYEHRDIAALRDVLAQVSTSTGDAHRGSMSAP
jgi:3-hydroxyisobutyrate dehydrogenase-like beta-hydroxyacid dehydrogenase